MKLKSISDWQTRGVETRLHFFRDDKRENKRVFVGFFAGIRVWDVVSELVCLCTVPSPSNPFALDTRYIKSLPLLDRFLVTGALLNFLEMYVVYGNRDELHYDKGVSFSRCRLAAFFNQLHTHKWMFLHHLGFSLVSVVEDVKPLRRLHVQSLLELQRLRESQQLHPQDSLR